MEFKKIKCFFQVLIISIILPFFSNCSKDVLPADVNLSYNMLADKTWFLEYSQTISGNTTATNTYVGQPTYFINFLRNQTTVDSDGLSGTFRIEKNNNQLQLFVVAKTSNGNMVEYIYNLESVGNKFLIVSFTKNNVLTKYYYSSNK